MTLFNSYIHLSLATGKMDEKILADITQYLGFYCKYHEQNFVMFSDFRSYFEKEIPSLVQIIDSNIRYCISGGVGDDLLNGTDESELFFGNDGNDRIYGGAGADSLYGGAGADTLYGGKGNDTIQDVYGKNVIRFGDSL